MNIVLKPEELIVGLGRYNISSTDEPGFVNVRVKEIKIHPHWNNFEAKFDADIAIVLLDQSVVLTDLIKIACLPLLDGTDNDVIIGDGIVVGYGASENTDFQTATDLPKKVSLTAITNENCFLETPELLPLSSLRTFCAGGHNNGVCSGDSGLYSDLDLNLRIIY